MAKKQVRKTGVQKLSGMGRSSTVMPLPRLKPFKEMGASGTSIYGGYITSIDKSSDWSGTQKYVTSSDLAINTSIIAAGVHYFLNMIAHPRWSVRPRDEKNAEARIAAEFVEEVLHDMATPWSRIVRRAGMYRFHGFSIQEWTAKKRQDGKIGIQDIEPRPQHTIEQWNVSEDGKVEGVFQRSPQTGELLGLPRSKIIYIVDDTLSDSPEGLGLFRHLAEPFERLKQYYLLETIGYERDLRGMPLARAPITLMNRLVEQGELTEEEATAYQAAMTKIIDLEVKGKNTGLLLDSMPYEQTAADGTKLTGMRLFDFELVHGSGNGLQELAQAIDRTNREMARVIGVEHLMMGDQGGNRALAVDKSRNLYLIANSVLENIASAFEHDLIDPLWMLNGWDDETKPKLETEDVTFKDIDQITGALARMAQAGAVMAPDDPAIGDIRDLMGIQRPNPIDPALMGGLTPDGDMAEDVPQDEDEGGPPNPPGQTGPGVQKRGRNSRFVYEDDDIEIEESGEPLQPTDEPDEALPPRGTEKFDPNQPRDEIGRWTDTGASGDFDRLVELRADDLREAYLNENYEIRNDLHRSITIEFHHDSETDVRRANEIGSLPDLDWYAGRGYMEINKYLRDSLEREVVSDKVRAKLDNAVKNISAAMTLSKRDMIVYRGVSDRTYRELIDVSEYVDDGFVSTSALPKGARDFIDARGGFGRAKMLEIRVPKGSRSFNMGKVGPPGEFEVLLDKGTRFRVIGANKAQTVVRVEVVKS